MTIRCNVRDRTALTLPSQRTTTPEGFLIAPGTLARTGIYEYAAGELGLDASHGMDANRTIKLHRDAADVLDTESLASFENKPLTLEHPPEGVDSRNWKTHSAGFVRDVRADGDKMLGTLVISDQRAIDAVTSGKAELSNGYGFDLELATGKTPEGIVYDGTMKRLRGNHVAIVTSARGGSACRIYDSGKSMTTRKVHIKGVPFDLDEAPAAAVEALATDAKQSADAVASLTGKLSGLKVGDRALSVEEATKLIADQGAKIVELTAQAMTPEKLSALVADHARTVEAASRIAPKIVIDNKTPAALKREAIAVAIAGDSTAAKDMIKAVLGEQSLDKAPDQVVDTLFSALGAIFPKGSSASNAVDAGREIAAGLATHHGNDAAGADQWDRFAAMDHGGNHAGGPQIADLLIGGYQLVDAKA